MHADPLPHFLLLPPARTNFTRMYVLMIRSKFVIRKLLFLAAFSLVLDRVVQHSYQGTGESGGRVCVWGGAGKYAFGVGGLFRVWTLMHVGTRRRAQWGDRLFLFVPLSCWLTAQRRKGSDGRALFGMVLGIERHDRTAATIYA